MPIETVMYQDLLQDDKIASALAAEVVLDVFAGDALLVVARRRALSVFEAARGEDAAGRERATFVLAVGAVADCLCHRLGVELELDRATHTRAFMDHCSKFRSQLSTKRSMLGSFGFDSTGRGFYTNHAVRPTRSTARANLFALSAYVTRRIIS
jgi:hypothetical protein